MFAMEFRQIWTVWIEIPAGIWISGLRGDRRWFALISPSVESKRWLMPLTENPTFLKAELDPERGSLKAQVIDSVAVVRLPLEVTVARNRINIFESVTDSGPHLLGQLTVSSPNICIAGEIPPFTEGNFRLDTNDAIQGVLGIGILDLTRPDICIEIKVQLKIACTDQ